MKQKRQVKSEKGKLRIGNVGNAITIIALSQNNPLKAVAEFVENCIDAKAKNITIIRAKERNEHVLKIVDDGQGVPKDEKGIPDFKYVATHICDSIKRRIKKNGGMNIQGEFGIGLLSFWTVGERLSMLCSGEDGKTYQMNMEKGKHGYEIVKRRMLVDHIGTTLIIKPLLSGVRILNGEKIQRYLSSELRNRIRQSNVKIKIIDRVSRNEYQVEPREFDGQLLHQLKPIQSEHGDIYVELYLNNPDEKNKIGLYKSGTRVVPDITALEFFNQSPWNSRALQGLIDVPFLNLTPGTRDGIIQDDIFGGLCQALEPLSEQLNVLVDAQRKAEEEKANKTILRSVQSAFKEAMLNLPVEEYNWFDIHGKKKTNVNGQSNENGSQPVMTDQDTNNNNSIIDMDAEEIKPFFEIAGPLFSIKISPKSSMVMVGKTRPLHAIARDRKRIRIDQSVDYKWEILEGQASFDSFNAEIITLTAPDEPGMVRVKLTVTQGDIVCQDEAIITVVDSIMSSAKDTDLPRKGLPGYTLKRSPGENWRSIFDHEKNIVVINKGHRDYVFSSKSRASKLRYLCKLFSKELILSNFPGLQTTEALERMIELSIHTEQHLK